jgi:hypothetical protein
MEADFSGYATKAGLKCSDGRTIMPDAFKHMDGLTVPLVWQHSHNEPTNVLGHAVLEARTDGVYAHGFFNSTPTAENAKALVQHNDIVSLSIYANQLVEKSKNVLHGVIREVSLVLSGANPGALIDNVSIRHSDGDIEDLEDEAIIYTGLQLLHADSTTTSNAPEGLSIQEVYDGFTEEQKNVVEFIVGAAVEASSNTMQQSGLDSDEISEIYEVVSEEIVTETPANEDESTDNDSLPVAPTENVTEDVLEHQKGTQMSHNVFEQAGSSSQQDRPSLTHAQLSTIVEDAQKLGSFKESFLAHAVEYGIENIDYLFPDAKTIDGSPEWVARRMEWVSVVINGAKKNPFSRIKTMSADITLDDARAKGYVKGNLKKDEWFALSKRVTTPTTIYKKQKLDRDDIVDITDLDVVAWLKAEMRIMLDEELARAALVGDGREIDDEDKVNETNIRPIAFDDDFYTHKVTVANGTVGDGIVDAIVNARPAYRGLGNPTMFTTEALLTSLLLVKDTTGRRIYPTTSDLAAALRVSNIVTVPVMEGVQTNTGDLLCVLVNMSDYTFGADRGGNISMFDDFDIDYNQYKYLIETRVSGTLTKFKTAIAVSRGTTGSLVTPGIPTFVTSTGVLTIPSTANVVYTNGVTGTTFTAGAQTAIAAGATVTVEATPAAGYYFPHNFDADWSFTRTA